MKGEETLHIFEKIARWIATFRSWFHPAMYIEFVDKRTRIKMRPYDVGIPLTVSCVGTSEGGYYFYRTGIRVTMGAGYSLMISPIRETLQLYGITVTPEILPPDYKGEICVPILFSSSSTCDINMVPVGTLIAQLVPIRRIVPKLKVVADLVEVQYGLGLIDNRTFKMDEAANITKRGKWDKIAKSIPRGDNDGVIISCSSCKDGIYRKWLDAMRKEADNAPKT